MTRWHDCGRTGGGNKRWGGDKRRGGTLQK